MDGNGEQRETESRLGSVPVDGSDRPGLWTPRLPILERPRTAGELIEMYRVLHPETLGDVVFVKAAQEDGGWISR